MPFTSDHGHPGDASGEGSQQKLQVRDARAFWPVQADQLSRLTGVFPSPTSHHRLVWVDLRVR
jgi:hypothetical protein